MSFFNRYRRAGAHLVIYSAVIGIAFFLAYAIRFDFSVPEPYRVQRMHYVGLVILLKLATLALAGQFRSMITFFGIPELLRIGAAMVLSTALLMTMHFVIHRLFELPRAMLLVDFMLCLGGICFVRLATRIYRDWRWQHSS